MSKDAYYFSHDSNARNDQRLMKVRMKYGMEGYGIYFGIIEILRETEDYTLEYPDSIESIAYDLRVDFNLVEYIVNDFNLFIINEEKDIFYSNSLKRRMEKLDEKRRIRSEAGKKGGKASAKLKQKSTIAQSLNKRKEKKTKLKDINQRLKDFEIDMQSFINQYDENLLKEFFDYWTEPNKSNTKMKFELQQTFDISRRLKTWERNDFGNKKNGVKKQHNFQMPDGKNYLGYCSKCLDSDFYETFNFNPDIIESRCCSSKLLSKRPENV